MHSLPSVHTDQLARSTSWPALLLPVLPAMAIVLLWWPSLPASFQFDDWNVIVNEPRVHSLAAWWQSMPGIRPLLKLSYALNMSVDAGPMGFRVVNILIHALSATLVWSLLRTRGVRAGLAETVTSRAALLAALIFALHPVQTEAVTYISGRSSSLAACFCLLSLYCWVRSEQTRHPPGVAGWLAACCVCFGLAVATKETALVLPLALLLYSADRPVSLTVRRLTPVLSLMALMLCIALSLPTYRRLLAVSLDTRSIAENLLTQAHAVSYLAGQLLRVWNSNADPQLPVITSLNWLSAGLCAAWLNLVVLSLLRLRRAPIGCIRRVVVPAVAGSDQLAAAASGYSKRSAVVSGVDRTGVVVGDASRLMASHAAGAICCCRCAVGDDAGLGHASTQRRLPNRDHVLAGRRRAQPRQLTRRE